MASHTHICANSHCLSKWQCDGVGKGKVCEVDKAAKANHGGPWCALCYHLEMAHRYAQARGLARIGHFIDRANREPRLLS
jgi:hypothetical protein